MDRTAVVGLAREIVGCRVCFESGERRHARNPLPQPHYVPDGYFVHRPRVLLIGQNPGAGAARTDDADPECERILPSLARDAAAWDDYLRWNRKDVGNWGQYKKMLDALGLDMGWVALGNAAMYAVAKDEQFDDRMAVTCGFLHLRRWLEVLEPDVVVLIGGAARAWDGTIRVVLRPRPVQIERACHYAAHRPWDSKAKEYDQLRKAIEAWRPEST